MAGAVVVHVPVHGSQARAEGLDAVHADISVSGLRVSGVDSSKGDVATVGRVIRLFTSTFRGGVCVEDLSTS